MPSGLGPTVGQDLKPSGPGPGHGLNSGKALMQGAGKEVELAKLLLKRHPEIPDVGWKGGGRRHKLVFFIHSFIQPTDIFLLHIKGIYHFRSVQLSGF